MKKLLSSKNKHSTVLLLLFLLNITTKCKTVEGDYSYFGLPFIHRTNPSKIAYQKGIPTGIRYTYESPRNWGLKTGIAYPVNNSGVSFVYGFTKQTNVHLLSAGVSQKIDDRFSVGTGLNMSLDFDEISQMSVDLAAAHVKNDFSISIVLKEIKFTDTSTVTIPSLNLIVSGPIKQFRNNISYELYVSAGFPKNKIEIPYPGGAFNVRYSSLRHPWVVVSSGFDFFQTESRDYQSSFSVSAGMNIGRNRGVAGMHAGYVRCVEDGRDILSTSLFFNPYGQQDITPPNVKLSYEKHPEMGYYFSLYSKDNQRGSGIRDWVLVIADNPSMNGKIVKLFSGGSIPPSTIYWDRRDSEGNFRQQKVYARLVAVDRADNKSVTEWVELGE